MNILTRAALAVVIGFLLLLPALADETMAVPPAPAGGQPLFKAIPEAADQACPTKDEVIRHYLASRTELKAGRVKLLARGLPQSFSDEWRRRLHMASVPVSSVVGQPLDLRSIGGGAAIDVTEFGADGCAISRTIMPAVIWMELVRAASGVQI